MADQPLVVPKRLKALFDPSFERRSIGTTLEIDLARNRSGQDQMNVGIHETRKDPSVSSIDRWSVVPRKGTGGFDRRDPASFTSNIDLPPVDAAVSDRQR